VSDRRKRIEKNLFSEADKVSPQELDNSIFGTDGWFDGIVEDETINYVQIQQIYADPTQPRRAVPSYIGQGWDGNPQLVQQIFESWLQAVNDERGSQINLKAYFMAMDTDRADDALPEAHPQSLEANFMAVVDLAVSIRRDGLTNPITVAPHKNGYMIETGERRWLAFHMLDMLFNEVDGDKWQNIPARVVDKSSIWRQASENNVRADLNAIDKARQFALLLMDLLKERGANFTSFSEYTDAGMMDRTYYAQIANSEEYRIPRGKSDQMINAMGLKHVRQLSYYRNLLTLPDEAWQMADNYNIAERALRQCIADAAGDAHTLVLLVRQIIETGQSPYQRIPSAPSSSSKKSSSGGSKLNPYATFTRHARNVNTYLGKPGALNKKQKQDALKKIQEMRIWLADAEKKIQSKGK